MVFGLKVVGFVKIALTLREGREKNILLEILTYQGCSEDDFGGVLRRSQSDCEWIVRRETFFVCL